MGTEELGASELGTLEYWEDRYKDEMKNFSNNGDIGEMWFGDDIVDRIINWFLKRVPDKSTSIIDIGCGNGHMLIELANLGYTRLIGLDYSEKAIDLAKTIARKQKLNIDYSVNNVLEEVKGEYDIIHDKGTYDAISLSENSKENREKYAFNMKAALKNSGLFIMTSCNWTHHELKEQFKDYFELSEEIPTPQFKFGGKVGSIVSICVFKKIEKSI